MPDESWLQMKTVMTILGVSRQFLYDHRADGVGPPFHQRGRKILYLKSEIDDWMRRNRGGTITADV